MDALVASATGQAEEGEGGAEAPSESEGAAFARKLENYRDTLPEDERPLADGMVIASGVVEEEVTGHAWVQAWTAGQHITVYGVYWAACHLRPGYQRLDFTQINAAGVGRYRCYDWR
jgi:hypothetical protein